MAAEQGSADSFSSVLRSMWVLKTSDLSKLSTTGQWDTLSTLRVYSVANRKKLWTKKHVFREVAYVGPCQPIPSIWEICKPKVRRHTPPQREKTNTLPLQISEQE